MYSLVAVFLIVIVSRCILNDVINVRPLLVKLC